MSVTWFQRHIHSQLAPPLPRHRYTVTVCPGSNLTHNCSGHGTCTDGVCGCDVGHFGRACSTPNCTLNCLAPGAECIATDHGFCVCNATRAGPECTQAIEPDGWYPANVPLVPGRVEGLVGHTTVYSETTDTAWTYGGFDIRSYLSIVVQLNFTSGVTTAFEPTASGWPSGRYMQSAVLTTIASNEIMVIFGGSDGEAS
jgi:hypothetical protein